MNRTMEAVRAEKPGPAGQMAAGLLEVLQERIGPQKYNAWFRHGTGVVIEDAVVKVTVPNPFVANWVETHYQDDLAAAALAVTGIACMVRVSVDPALSGTLRKTQLDSQAQIVDMAAQGRTRPAHEAPRQVLRHRLEEFVVGESNRLAYMAAIAVASGGAVSFNPLFIHGTCGVGKTHLLQGICEMASRSGGAGKRERTWRYVTGEQFTNEFITALRHKKIDEFRARYRKLDLLAIDDVHFLAAKKATQDEFLHTFNTIASAGRQIVMASDAHPRMVGELNEQLISRFMAGMVVKVSAPDQATRLEVLKRRAAAMRLPAASEVLEYIAMHVRGSVRELEGALFKLSAIASLEGGTVTLAMASEAMADHLARTDSAVTLGDIEAATAAFFGITPADLHSSRRTRTVSAARMVAMFLARRHTRMSFPEIGKYMGKNHSSAVLAVQRMEELLADDAQLDWLSPMGPKAQKASQVLELLTEQFAK